MDRAWLGGIRVLLILIVGIATIVSGWKARRARHEKKIAKDYILLFVSGLILTAAIIGVVIWDVLYGVKLNANGRYLIMFVVLGLGGALTYFSNRMIGRRGRQK